MRRRVVIVIFPGFQLLDAAGPITAFEIAERFRPGSYDLALLAPGGSFRLWWSWAGGRAASSS